MLDFLLKTFKSKPNVIRPNIDFYFFGFSLFIGGLLGGIYLAFFSSYSSDRIVCLIPFAFMFYGFITLIKAKIITIYPDKKTVQLRYLFTGKTFNYPFSSVSFGIPHRSDKSDIFLNSLNEAPYKNRRFIFNHPFIQYKHLRINMGDRKFWIYDYFYKNVRSLIHLND